MLIDIDVDMQYQLSGDDQILLTILPAATSEQSVQQVRLDIENASHRQMGTQGDAGQRIWAFVTGSAFNLRYQARVNVTRAPRDLASLAVVPMHSLPDEVLTYLRPSRFCQSDLFTSFVGQEFSHLENGAKLVAILNWVGAEIAYVSGSSDAGTTAIDTFVTRQGVCRDFAHLFCSLARAAGIPARYTSVYGVGVTPPDFHAVAQVWLDDGWHIVDPTGMTTPDAQVVIATGRDAADVAFMESSQPAQPINQVIQVTQVT